MLISMFIIMLIIIIDLFYSRELREVRGSRLGAMQQKSTAKQTQTTTTNNYYYYYYYYGDYYYYYYHRYHCRARCGGRCSAPRSSKNTKQTIDIMLISYEFIMI